MIIPTVKVKRGDVVVLINEDDYDSTVHELIGVKAEKKDTPIDDTPEVVDTPAEVVDTPAVDEKPEAVVKRTTSRKKKKS